MFVEPLRYAGFWRRLGAYLLDFLVMLPLGGLIIFGNTQYRFFSLYVLLPMTAFQVFYGIYLVRRFGGTPGKLATGLRIRKVDGSPVGYREATLRFFPELGLWFLLSVALLVPLFQITDDAYFSFSVFQRPLYLIRIAPSWYQPVNVANQIWIWSEFIVLLTNRKRRALHDFIAGTVVIVVKPPTQSPEATIVTPPA
jgi:uncharacterized RDD family membrane protein YckC